MSDQPFYAPNRPLAPRRQPKPDELVWTLRVDYVTWSCEFRFHDESYWSHAHILGDGELVIGQRYALREWLSTRQNIISSAGCAAAHSSIST